MNICPAKTEGAQQISELMRELGCETSHHLIATKIKIAADHYTCHHHIPGKIAVPSTWGFSLCNYHI